METALPNPEIRLPKPAAGTATPARVDDRAVMAVGIVGFGLTIPWLTGLFGPLGPFGPRPAVYWLGTALFVALAAAIWLGNRWLLFKQREHFDWFSQPLRKLTMLVAANVLYTAPVTLAGLAAWYALAGWPADPKTLQLVALTNVVCVLFVTHAYETIFLIREREGDLLRVEREQRQRAQAELAALKAQVDPHFLFNSLNTLGHLVEREPARAREFCDALAEVYRYVLDSRERDLVPLADELAFLGRYHRLLELRFGAAVPLAGLAPLQAQAGRWLIVPMALQGLLENAVKHNQASSSEPLAVQLRLEVAPLDTAARARVIVANALRPRRSSLRSAGLGLANLDERCRLLAGQPLERREAAGRFEVAVPLVAAAAARPA